MTKEEKDLLFKDLCARLPYHIKVKVWLKDGTTEEGPLDLQHNYGDVLIDAFYYNKIVDIKPYLRSMSSMTEEECKELGELPATINNISETFPNTPYYIEVAKVEQINWLLERHFDFCGLIEKGLAIEVTKENNPYET